MTPLPFSTVIVVSRGGGAFTARFFGFSFSATAVALSGDSTSGCANSWTAERMFSSDVVSSAKPSSPSIDDWKMWPGGRP